MGNGTFLHRRIDGEGVIFLLFAREENSLEEGSSLASFSGTMFALSRLSRQAIKQSTHNVRTNPDEKFLVSLFSKSERG